MQRASGHVPEAAAGGVRFAGSGGSGLSCRAVVRPRKAEIGSPHRLRDSSGLGGSEPSLIERAIRQETQTNRDNRSVHRSLPLPNTLF